MRKLNIYYVENHRSNFRYVTALMIEARIREYPLLDKCPESLSESVSFEDFINEIIDWLIENYPTEFQKKLYGEEV